MFQICNFPECDDPAHSKGWCIGHYKQAHNGQTLKPKLAGRKKINTSQCVEYFCDSIVVTKGRCRKHHRQMVKFKVCIPYGAVCAGCRSKEKLTVDHDHSCCDGDFSCGKCVRGFLCNSCNLALAFAKDDITVLERLIEYIKN